MNTFGKNALLVKIKFKIFRGEAHLSSTKYICESFQWLILKRCDKLQLINVKNFAL